MGAKTDTSDIEALFIETPISRGRNNKVGAKPLKTAKTRHDPFQGVSSLGLVKELFKRHYVDLQVLGFWLVLAVIVWLKLGR